MSFYSKEKVMEIVERVLNPSPDIDMLFTGSTYEFFLKPYCEEIVRFETGASKLVLIPDEDFVIKIPFKGEYRGYVYAEDTPSEILPDKFGSLSEDYCDRELCNYKDAVAQNIQYFFAPVDYVQEYGALSIYVQTKCDTNALHPHRLSDEEKTSIEKTLEYTDCDAISLSEVALVELIKTYGEEKVQRFLDFCDDYGINDLHINNFGTFKNKLVAIDFSGWYD